MLSVHASRPIAALLELRELVWSDASAFVKLRIALALALVLLAAVISPLGTVCLKFLVDRLTDPSDARSLSALLLIALYVTSQWIGRTAGEVRGLLYARAERRMSRQLSERMLRHVLRLPLRFHLNKHTGALTQVLASGIQGYQSVLHNVVFSVLPVFAELATIVFVLSRLGQPIFLALFCAALGCYTVGFYYAARRTMAAARRASRAQVESTAAFSDGIVNCEVVKCFVAETAVEQKVGTALMQTESEWVRFYRQYALNGVLVATIFAAFLASTVVYAAREVRMSHMTLGTFVLINGYMLQIVRPVEALGYALQGIAQGLAYLERLLALFREPTERQAEDESTELARGAMEHPPGTQGRLRMGKEWQTAPAEIVFHNVSLSQGFDRAVLHDVSFTVPPGKTLGIVGPSGSGKSTIGRLLVRLFEPDSGQILLDGIPTSKISLETLRRSVAIVPQETLLFDDTIAYNIGFGKVRSTQAEIERAARLAHLHEFVMRLPRRYRTRVGERGVRLSGGERQRVAIARAALKRPRVYVFDEATSSLDSHSEKEILSNLHEISHSCTTLVIAHRLSTVVHADEIIVLDGGSIVERGSHSWLLNNGAQYAALWRAQQHTSVDG